MVKVTPGEHAARGAALALAGLTALSNLMGNRKGLMAALRGDLTRFQLSSPSRNVAALAVVIGVFRYVQRSIQEQRQKARDAATESSSGSGSHGTAGPDIKASVRHIEGVVPASIVASALGVLCLAPKSRPGIVSLLATDAASVLFRDFLAKNPELAYLRPLEMVAFVASMAWMFFATYKRPESYEPSHLRNILKYMILTKPQVAQMQDKYRQGINADPCTMRHPGMSCTRFAFSNFPLRIAAVGFDIYFLVHLTTSLLGLRRAKKVNMEALTAVLRRVGSKCARSISYFVAFVYGGWLTSCATGKLFGHRSAALRNLQFAISSGAGGLALLIEPPNRRRPMGVILASYQMVSIFNVLFGRAAWMRPGAIRSVLEAGVVAAAVAATVSNRLEGSYVAQRVLLGDEEARAFQTARRLAKEAAKAHAPEAEQQQQQEMGPEAEPTQQIAAEAQQEPPKDGEKRPETPAAFA